MCEDFSIKDSLAFSKNFIIMPWRGKRYILYIVCIQMDNNYWYHLYKIEVPKKEYCPLTERERITKQIDLYRAMCRRMYLDAFLNKERKAWLDSLFN